MKWIKQKNRTKEKRENDKGVYKISNVRRER